MREKLSQNIQKTSAFITHANLHGLNCIVVLSNKQAEAVKYSAGDINSRRYLASVFCSLTYRFVELLSESGPRRNTLQLLPFCENNYRPVNYTHL